MKAPALVLALLAGGGAVIAANAARAAEVRVRVPEGCGQKADVVDQVEGLLGQPLASIPGVEFEVEIAPGKAGRWWLRLDTLEGPGTAGSAGETTGETTGARRTRELVAATCAELVDAAAMAITLTIRSIDGDRPAPVSPGVQPAPASPRPPTSTQDRGTPERAVARGVSGDSPPNRVRAALAVGAIGDVGSLPGVGAGLEVSGWMQLHRVRLAASGAVLAPQEKRLADGSGGSFQLVVGAIGLCLPRELGRSTFFACGGLELAYLWAEGVGLDHPRQGGASWEAARADLGLSVPLGPSLALVVRGGASVPFSRPDFAVGGAVPVHRPSSLVARAGLAVEMGF